LARLNETVGSVHRVRLIHWKAGEAAERIGRLRSAGYEVDFDESAPAILKALRQHPPEVVVIDLARLPAQGRDMALAVRHYKATRHLPVVFVEGDEEKVDRIRKQIPDAVYTTWRRIRSAVKNAIANPPARPIAPRTLLDGYTGTPLVKKLGIKENSIVALLGAPKGFENVVGTLPARAVLRRGSRGSQDLTIWFTKSRAELDKRIGAIGSSLGKDGLWIVWPKRSSGVVTDLTQAVVRQVGLASGLVDYKISSIDATWSGLRFARRK
jgi:CheY-like chemotaxis protein